MNLFYYTRGDNGDDKVKATDFFMGVLSYFWVRKEKRKEKIIIAVKGKKMIVAMSNVDV